MQFICLSLPYFYMSLSFLYSLSLPPPPLSLPRSILLFLSRSHAGYDFPVEFVSIVRKIFRTYFAILAHIYYHHFSSMHRLGLHDGLNTLLLHFIYFVNEFSLMEPKEYQCLDELISKLMQIEQELAKNPPIEELRSLGIHDDYVHIAQPAISSSRSNASATASTTASSSSSKSNHT